jgi:thymidylate kinase
MGLRIARRQHDILLFDRFIHDLLVDPMRYRMGRAGSWIHSILLLAPRPDLAVIITAPTETIQSRKREVPVSETERQVDAYIASARLFPKSLLVDNSGTPDDVVNVIVRRILDA